MAVEHKERHGVLFINNKIKSYLLLPAKNAIDVGVNKSGSSQPLDHDLILQGVKVMFKRFKNKISQSSMGGLEGPQYPKPPKKDIAWTP